MSNDIRWDLSHLYKSDDDTQIEKDRKSAIKTLKDFLKKWGDSTEFTKRPNILVELLNDLNQLVLDDYSGAKAYFYFALRSSQEKDNADITALLNKALDFYVKQSNQLTYIDLAISKIGKVLQNEFLEYKELAVYKHYLEKSFLSAKYLLTEKEENLISIVSKTSSGNWGEMLSTLLSTEEAESLTEDGERKVLSFSEISDLMNSINKAVRDEAAKHFHGFNKKYADVATHEFNSIIEFARQIGELRAVERPDTMRHISDDLSSEVVDQMLFTVSSANDIPSKYYKAKAALLNVDKLQFHERNVPYGKSTRKYSYQESVDLIKKVFADLHPKFGEIAAKFENEGLIDVTPRKGKVGGAFCYGMGTTTPSYILLNHTNELADVLTLAHELGHGINNYLMSENQNELNYGSPLSTAEVASTFFEDFVLQEILKTANKEEKKAILMKQLNNDVSTIYRQVAAYQFEQEIHKQAAEKGFLSKKQIGETFMEKMKSYIGDSVSYEPGSENWWVYWSHFRRPFYVYSYASGLLISKSLQKMVKESPESIEKVLYFLGAGGSESPEKIFANVGIDITAANFWKAGVEESKRLLSKIEAFV